MSLISFLALFCLLVLNIACTSKANFPLAVVNENAQQRNLLVTFVDKTVNRRLPGNAQDQYQATSVYTNSSWSEGVARKLAERYRLQMLAQWPMTELGVSCVVYQVPDFLPLNETINILQKDSEVNSVQSMHDFQALAETPSAKLAYNDPYLPLQTAFNTFKINELHKITTGKGIRIALIDSGVDLDHPDLKGQIDYSENMAPEPKDHNLADKHGTAVAGVLSARPNNGIGIVGIAPDAEVLALRACWPDQPNALASRCNSYTLAIALNQAIRLNSHIINLSLSGPEDPLLKMLIDKALHNKIIIIAAVPGQNQTGGFPANVPGVLAVSKNFDAHNNSIMAPGQDILTTVPHQAYDFMTGSSFATPIVSGLTALLLQLHPDWQSSDIIWQMHHLDSLFTYL